MSFNQTKRLSSLTRLEDCGPHNLISQAREKIKGIEKELDKMQTSDFATWSPEVRDVTIRQGRLFQDLADAYETMRDHIQNSADALKVHANNKEAELLGLDHRLIE